MIQLSCNEIKKYYGEALILKAVSFDAKEGERIAIVGKNGCGKTTLLRLLTGKETPDEGTVAIRKEITIGYLEQIPDYENEMSVQDVIEIAFAEQKEIRAQMMEAEHTMGDKEGDALEQALLRYGKLTERYESLDGYRLEERKNRICTGLKLSELFLQKRFSLLSGGEKTLALLAKILLQNPDVLVLDEPTNHLDIVMLDWLEQYLTTYSGTVIVVSHDRYFLDQVATKVIELRDGISIEYIGDYSAYVKEKASREAIQNAVYMEQQKQLAQMERAVKQMREWAARANNEKMFYRAEAMQKRIDRVERVEKPKTEEKPLNIGFGVKERSGKDVLALQHVTKSFGEHLLMKDLNFNVYYGEHVALIGRNGCGKTTLLKLVLGEELPDDGYVKVGESLKIGYLPQQVTFDNEEFTVIEAIRDTMVISEGKARELLARYQFYQEAVFKKIKNLSGGEKSRLKLVILMQKEINFLIMDEPTNHLDIASRESLEEALLTFTGTILFVSHDRYFINRIATRISEMEAMKTTDYYGDLDYYKQKKSERASTENRNLNNNSNMSSSSVNVNSNHTSKSKPVNTQKNYCRESISKNPYKKQALEEQIAQLEASIQSVKEEQEREQNNYMKLMELDENLRKLNEKLEVAMEEWMTL